MSDVSMQKTFRKFVFKVKFCEKLTLGEVGSLGELLLNQIHKKIEINEIR